MPIPKVQPSDVLLCNNLCCVALAAASAIALAMVWDVAVEQQCEEYVAMERSGGGGGGGGGGGVAVCLEETGSRRVDRQTGVAFSRSILMIKS